MTEALLRRKKASTTCTANASREFSSFCAAEPRLQLALPHRPPPSASPIGEANQTQSPTRPHQRSQKYQTATPTSTRTAGNSSLRFRINQIVILAFTTGAYGHGARDARAVVAPAQANYNLLQCMRHRPSLTGHVTIRNDGSTRCRTHATSGPSGADNCGPHLAHQFDDRAATRRETTGATVRHVSLRTLTRLQRLLRAVSPWLARTSPSRHGLRLRADHGHEPGRPK